MSSYTLELMLKTNFMDALKESNLRSFSFSDHAKTLMIVESGQVAAALIYREIEQAQLAEIDFIATAASFKRRGLATRLINELSVEFDEIWLELSCNNLKALSFYRKLGFLVQGKRSDYYGKGIHALNMVKTKAT